MTVNAAQVAALRAALDGDEEAFSRLYSTPEVASEGLPMLLTAAFVAAVRRRFPLGGSDSDVVRFVGRLRARNGGAFDDLNATAAEQLLLRVLRGKPLDGQLDEFAKIFVQFALLAELVRDFSEQDLGVFLAEARQQAEVWLAQHSGH